MNFRNIVPLINVFVFLFCSINIQSAEKPEYRIYGIVTDSASNKPIEYANIALYSSIDSALVTGTITNESGRFTLSNFQLGNYYIIIQFIGYKKEYVNNILLNEKQKVIELPVIKMKTSSFELDEVSIRSEQKPVEQKLDKKIINVSQNISSVGGTAVDVLQNNLAVKINSDGDALLRNSSNFLVLIDGRQSPIQGTDALRQIPANTIEK